MQYQEADPKQTSEQAEEMVNEFFDALKPRPRQGRAWTFHHLTAACDNLKGRRIQAVLYPHDEEGFALYARSGQTLHAVTHKQQPVRFRTIEKALSTLVEVPYLDPEIVVDSSKWHEVLGPL